MNWSQIEGSWKQFKGTMKAQWDKLTDTDLDRMIIKKSVIARKIKKNYGIVQNEAIRRLGEIRKTASGPIELTKRKPSAKKSAVKSKIKIKRKPARVSKGKNN